MAEFIRYQKIRTLGALQNQDILTRGEIVIQEKIDGANVSIRTEIDEDGNKNLLLGSHYQWVDKTNKQFATFYDWAHSHAVLKELDTNIILYGEFLKPHTIQYPKEKQNKFYLFDVYDINNQVYLPIQDVVAYANKFNLEYIKPWFVGTSEELGDYLDYVGKSDFGAENGEGIVIKNYSFINRFGVQAWAKIVREEFKEQLSKSHPKKQQNKNTQELDVLNRFVTKARVIKFINKARNGAIDMGEFCYYGDMQDMRWLPKLIYDDIIEEHAYDICKDYARIDFEQMKKKCAGVVACRLKEVLNEQLLDMSRGQVE